MDVATIAAVAEASLIAVGVTAATVGYAASLRDDEQLRARDFFQRIDRPATAIYSYPGWPVRFPHSVRRAHMPGLLRPSASTQMNCCKTFSVCHPSR